MKPTVLIIAASALSLGLAACAEPGGSDTADMAPEATSADVTDKAVVGDSSSAPDMASVQLALEQACPTMAPAQTLREVACEADDLGASFDCRFAFTGDPAGVDRTLGIRQAGEGWAVDAEPALCSSLERADAMAGEPAAATVPTQPSDR